MEAEYQGTGTLVADGREIPVELHVSGHVEPVDGWYRWAGRIKGNDLVRELASGRNRTVTVRTDGGHTAEGTLGDVDPWGGCRISGKGAPPFPVPTDPDDVGDPH